MNFIIELIVRLFSKTPKFFTTLKIVLAIVTVITGIPAFLTESGIVFPDAWQPVILKVVSVASLVGTIISQMTMTDTDKEDNDIKD
jgi:hypothetical protein